MYVNLIQVPIVQYILDNVSVSQQNLQITPLVQHIIFSALQDQIMTYSVDKIYSQYIRLMQLAQLDLIYLMQSRYIHLFLA